METPLGTAFGCQELVSEVHEDADIVQHEQSSGLREEFGAVLEAAEEVLRATIGVAIDVSTHGAGNTRMSA